MGNMSLLSRSDFNTSSGMERNLWFQGPAILVYYAPALMQKVGGLVVKWLEPFDG